MASSEICRLSPSATQPHEDRLVEFNHIVTWLIAHGDVPLFRDAPASTFDRITVDCNFAREHPLAPSFEPGILVIYNLYALKYDSKAQQSLLIFRLCGERGEYEFAARAGYLTHPPAIQSGSSPIMMMQARAGYSTHPPVFQSGGR